MKGTVLAISFWGISACFALLACACVDRTPAAPSQQPSELSTLTSPSLAPPTLSGLSEADAARALDAAYAALDHARVTPTTARAHFRATRVTRDSFGVTTCRFQQNAAGLRVVDHEALVHVDVSGNARVSSARFLPVTIPDPASSISNEQARRAARVNSGDAARIGMPTLVIWPTSKGASVIAYEVLVERGLKRELLYIAGQSGEIVGRRTLTMP